MLFLATTVSPANLNTSQTPFSHFLQNCFTACRWQAVCCSCSRALLPWLLGTAHLAQALLTQWHTQVKREAEHWVRELNCRPLLLGQNDMKDNKNSWLKTKRHSGNTTMQYSTQNRARCRIFYAIENQHKLHKDSKSKNSEEKLASKTSKAFLPVSLD